MKRTVLIVIGIIIGLLAVIVTYSAEAQVHLGYMFGVEVTKKL